MDIDEKEKKELEKKGKNAYKTKLEPEDMEL